MKYSSHIKNIKSHFPKIDLLKESEIDLFENEKSAMSCIKICIDLCNHTRQILDCNLSFGIKYDVTFNASVTVRNRHAVIIFNHGLIEKLHEIIVNSVELFLTEQVARLTVNEKQKDRLQQILFDCSIHYLFYHEVAHIIQILDDKGNTKKIIYEKYPSKNLFDLEQHIYELDADLFGSMISTIQMMKNIMDKNHQFQPIILFDSLTALLFVIGNIIIEFSGNSFNEIYFKKNRYPHPFVRIIKCKEQILDNIHKNLKTKDTFLLTSLRRATKMISQLQYSDGRTLNYDDFYNKHAKGIEEYIDEIENSNIKYSRLTRYKSKSFINNFINKT